MFMLVQNRKKVTGDTLQITFSLHQEGLVMSSQITHTPIKIHPLANFCIIAFLKHPKHIFLSMINFLAIILDIKTMTVLTVTQATCSTAGYWQHRNKVRHCLALTMLLGWF